MKTDYRWIAVPIPFTDCEIVVARFEYFGPIRFLKKYDYVWRVQKREKE